MSMEFFNYCYNGQLSEAQKLYEAGDIDLNFQDPGKRTFIAIAASRGHDEVVKWLLSIGSPLEIKDRNGRTALALAAINSRIDTMKLLIEARADLNAVSEDEKTILMETLLEKQSVAAQLLIACGAAIDVVDKKNRNALHYAALNRLNEVAKLLTEKGTPLNVMDQYFLTPLGYALKQRQFELAEFFIQAGADINYKKENGSPILYELIASHNRPAVEWCFQHNADPLFPNANGSNIYPFLNRYGMEDLLPLAEELAKKLTTQREDTPALWISRGITDIITAIQKNHPKMVEYFISSEKIDVNAEIIFFGESTYLFCIAIRYNAADVFDCLLDHGLNINQILSIKNHKTYLDYAISYHNTKTIYYLLEHGADPNQVLDYGTDFYINPLLTNYSYYDQTEDLPGLIKAFIHHGAKIDFSVLSNLCSSGIDTSCFKELCQILLDHCSNINDIDPYGNTILHELLYQFRSDDENQTILFDKLLNVKGIDINLYNDNNHSPLYYACRYATVRVVKQLLEAGANPDASVWEAATDACNQNNSEVLNYLLESGMKQP